MILESSAAMSLRKTSADRPKVPAVVMGGVRSAAVFLLAST